MKLGDHVRSHVSVLGKRVPMHDGIVVEVSADGGVCKVDRMSLHGGAPWIVHEATSDLSLVESDK